MTKDYSKYRKRKTRLTRLEEKRNIKQAFVFILLTISLIFAGLVFGFPMFLRVIVWFSDLRKKPPASENTSMITLAPPNLDTLSEATNSSKFTVRGFAQEDTKIKIYINGEAQKEISPTPNGEFIYTLTNLKKGDNTIKAQAIDSKGNSSDYSSEYTVIYDDEKPKLEINSPKDGDKFYGKDREIKITGTTESSVTLTINDRVSVVDSQGNFSTSFELRDGDNELKLKAKDLAGNETIVEIKVNYSP